MCNNPFLLVAVNNEGTKTYKTFPSEGQAEVEGMNLLNGISTMNLDDIITYYVSFSIYSIVSSFQKVTKIERVSLAPTKED